MLPRRGDKYFQSIFKKLEAMKKRADISQDEEKQLQYTARQKIIYDYNTRMDERYKRGSIYGFAKAYVMCFVVDFALVYTKEYANEFVEYANEFVQGFFKEFNGGFAEKYKQFANGEDKELAEKFAEKFAKEYAEGFAEKFAEKFPSGFAKEFAEKFAKEFPKKFAEGEAKGRAKFDEEINALFN